jgi:uncharacterized membrane protein YccC
MKKILALLVAAGAAFLVLTKLRSKPDEDLWHEATTR